MRALKVAVLAAAAALTLAAVPASAGPHLGGGGHWGGHGWGHHGWGWGGPGLVFGLGAAALAAGAYESCVSYVPVYDDFGNVVGRRPVNAC
jgi:hypothetical protein